MAQNFTLFPLQHMVIGGLPLVLFAVLNNDPALSLSLKEYSSTDILALLYTSVFGSAVSYGVFFYSATKGLYVSPSIILSFFFLHQLFSFYAHMKYTNPSFHVKSKMVHFFFHIVITVLLMHL